LRVFLDSSALVKRYIEEPGSGRIAELMHKASEIAVSIICVPEVISACNRLVREKKITADQYKWIKKEFLLDLGEVIVIDLSNEIIGRAIQCLEKGATRSLDALHVASAVEIKSKLFVTADERQRVIARRMGLKVELI